MRCSAIVRATTAAGEYADDCLSGSDRQMTEVMLAHERVRLGQRCFDIYGVWEGGHEGHDLGVALHGSTGRPLLYIRAAPAPAGPALRPTDADAPEAAVFFRTPRADTPIRIFPVDTLAVLRRGAVGQRDPRRRGAEEPLALEGTSGLATDAAGEDRYGAPAQCRWFCH